MGKGNYPMERIPPGKTNKNRHKQTQTLTKTHQEPKIASRIPSRAKYPKI